MDASPLPDFRESRIRLPPEAFAIAEGADLPPTDLIKKSVWASIVSFPDDVSLRTSNDQGAMSYFMPDAADEFQASIFNSLCGFYRVASDTLRAALEKATIGAYFQ